MCRLQRPTVCACLLSLLVRCIYWAPSLGLALMFFRLASRGAPAWGFSSVFIPLGPLRGPLSLGLSCVSVPPCRVHSHWQCFSLPAGAVRVQRPHRSTPLRAARCCGGVFECLSVCWSSGADSYSDRIGFIRLPSDSEGRAQRRPMCTATRARAARHTRSYACSRTSTWAGGAADLRGVRESRRRLSARGQAA